MWSEKLLDYDFSLLKFAKNLFVVYPRKHLHVLIKNAWFAVV